MQKYKYRSKRKIKMKGLIMGAVIGAIIGAEVACKDRRSAATKSRIARNAKKADLAMKPVQKEKTDYITMLEAKRKINRIVEGKDVQKNAKSVQNTVATTPKKTEQIAKKIAAVVDKHQIQAQETNSVHEDCNAEDNGEESEDIIEVTIHIGDDSDEIDGESAISPMEPKAYKELTKQEQELFEKIMENVKQKGWTEKEIQGQVVVTSVYRTRDSKTGKYEQKKMVVGMWCASKNSEKESKDESKNESKDEIDPHHVHIGVINLNE